MSSLWPVVTPVGDGHIDLVQARQPRRQTLIVDGGRHAVDEDKIGFTRVAEAFGGPAAPAAAVRVHSSQTADKERNLFADFGRVAGGYRGVGGGVQDGAIALPILREREDAGRGIPAVPLRGIRCRPVVDHLNAHVESAIGWRRVWHDRLDEPGAHIKERDGRAVNGHLDVAQRSGKRQRGGLSGLRGHTRSIDRYEFTRRDRLLEGRGTGGIDDRLRVQKYARAGHRDGFGVDVQK